MRQFILPMLMILVLTTAACASEAPLAEGVMDVNPPREIDAFTLTNHQGNPTTLDDLRGKLTLLSFGYTHCPDVCPVTLAHFRQVRELLGEDVARVNFVFISVDGKRDTPERLAAYLPNFRADIIGLTGDEATMRTIIGEFEGQFIINDAGGLRENYTVDHTASSFLLDTSGKWRRTYVYNTPSDIIANDIRRVMSS